LAYITRSLMHRFKTWERPAQIAVVLALALLVGVIAVASFGPPDVRAPAIIGIIGLMLVTQAVVLWANRDLISSYTAAQRKYLAGDFEAARDLLEAERAAGDVRSLTLLGNTYRQLAQLDASEAVLQEALAQSPDHHFPLYGLGRTLLAKGQYQEAAQYITAALDAGAPEVVKSDLGEALYRAGQGDAARQILASLDASDETPSRELMIAYLLYRLDAGSPPSRSLVESGIHYWRATAERFASTPYGAAVAEDVKGMREG
jgi:tetratricopeptide (TPR) repeat protein